MELLTVDADDCSKEGTMSESRGQRVYTILEVGALLLGPRCSMYDREVGRAAGGVGLSETETASASGRGFSERRLTMQYLWVDWIHDDFDTPVVLVYELGEERLIGRFIERFRNGEMVFEKGENTEGWYVPVPELDEIEALGEFRAKYIGREEFELLWALRNASE